MAATKSGATVRIPRAAYGGLALVAEHASKLAAIAQVAAAPETGSSLGRIADAASAKVGLSEEQVRDIVSNILAIHNVRMRFEFGPGELLEKVNACIEGNAPAEWREKYYDIWQREADAIRAALAPESPFAGLAKSIELTYAHQNVLQSARIVTDIRPIYDDDAENIERALVTHLLMIEYDSGEDTKRIHIAIDAADIRELKTLCERAERKTAVAVKALAPTGWSMVVTGGEADAE